MKEDITVILRKCPHHGWMQWCADWEVEVPTCPVHVADSLHGPICSTPLIEDRAVTVPDVKVP